MDSDFLGRRALLAGRRGSFCTTRRAALRSRGHFSRLLRMKQYDLSFPREVVLGDGSIVQLRPLIPADRDALVAGFNSLSPETRIRRFFFEKRAFSETEIHRLTHPDGVDHLAFLMEARLEDTPEAQLLAVARCFRDPHDPSLAEVALVTRDDWQGLGVGTALLHALSETAWIVGIRRWVAALFSENRTMRRLLSRVGHVSEDTPAGSGVIEIVCHLHAPAPAPGWSPQQRKCDP